MKIFLIVILSVLLVNCSSKNENEIVIASILPLTGQGAVVGENAKMAIDICIEKWNNRGGVNGKLIRVVHNDSKGESKQGQIIANKIVMNDAPDIVISGVSGVVLSAQPILERRGIIQQCVVSTDKIFQQKPSFTLRNYLSTPQLCDYFLELLGDKFNKSEFVLIYANSDYGAAFYESFNAKLNQYSKSIRNAIEVDQAGFDFKSSLIKAELKESDVVYVAAQYQSLGRIVKQLREIQYKGYIVCDAHLNSSSALDIIGDNRTGLFYIDVHKTEKADAIKKIIMQKYNKQADDIALIVYNGLDLLLSCVQQNKCLDNKATMDALDGFQYEGVLGLTGVKNNEVELNLLLKSL